MLYGKTIFNFEAGDSSRKEMIMHLCSTFNEKQMIIHNKDRIVVVKIFNDSLAANFAQSKLRDEGIESFLADENVVGLNPLGGIELKIFSNDLKKAKKILSEIKFS
jgi:hypothetical protein